MGRRTRLFTLSLLVCLGVNAGRAFAMPVGPDGSRQFRHPVAAQPTTWTVKAGDTLSSIAAQLHRTWLQLSAWNHITDPNIILVGEQLRVPPATYTAPVVLRASLAVVPIRAGAVPPPTPVAAAAGPSGWPASCYGITNPDALWIIARESGCNVYAQNPSGACGIGQRMNSCDGFNGYAQAADMTNYVMSRYGSWSAARAFKESRGWY